MSKPFIIAVVGPTASGKSELAVQLAKKYNGEIISADSRQIYRGFDISSGKVEGKWKQGTFVYKDIPHYLIDEANPKIQYNASRFQKNARKAIKQIIKRGKLPIICGGTAHWVDSVIFEQAFPEVKPNTKLRTKLEKLSTEKLFKKLSSLDPERAQEIDSQNKRRLIRALEIVMTTGKPVPKLIAQEKYHTVWLGINPGVENLEQKIEKRLKSRMHSGLIKEIEQLHKDGLSWKKLESYGLEYKFISLYLQNKISMTEMEQQLFRAIRQYSKRQLTWWKRNDQIHWEKSAKKLLSLAKTLI